MEEKVLIKSEQYNIKKIVMTIILAGAILSAILFFSAMSSNSRTYSSNYKKYLEHRADGDCGVYYDSWEKCYACERIIDNPSKFGFALSRTLDYNSYFLYPILATAIFGGFAYLWLRSYELTVTDKRIYGKVAWGKRVDLPVDSISATATISLFKGVSVSTSSGRISFLVIKNADEIYNIMNKLLIERQQAKIHATTVATAPKIDDADQLKKFKDLLDNGVITQEEFDAKKKQLLGL